MGAAAEGVRVEKGKKGVKTEVESAITNLGTSQIRQVSSSQSIHPCYMIFRPCAEIFI